MQFCEWLWILIDQRSNPARLRAGQILTHHSPSGQIQRIVAIDGITAWPPLCFVEVGLAIVRVELFIGEQHWRTRMVEIRTEPKDAFLFVDPFISDAVVVRDSAPGGDAKLFQNVGRVLERKILAST